MSTNPSESGVTPLTKQSEPLLPRDCDDCVEELRHLKNPRSGMSLEERFRMICNARADSDRSLCPLSCSEKKYIDATFASLTVLARRGGNRLSD